VHQHDVLDRIGDRRCRRRDKVKGRGNGQERFALCHIAASSSVVMRASLLGTNASSQITG
jgi:hypothetical protein